MNTGLHRTRNRRFLLSFDVQPDDDRLPTISCSIRGDRAKQYASALEMGSHVRVEGHVRTVVYMNAHDVASVEQARTVRCRRAGGMAR